jgi:antitoxin FitA
MATITIRNLPDDLVERIKLLARDKGVSMEQEIRDLLHSRYVNRGEVLERIRQRCENLPTQSSAELMEWKEQGRS